VKRALELRGVKVCPYVPAPAAGAIGLMPADMADARAELAVPVDHATRLSAAHRLDEVDGKDHAAHRDHD